MFISFEGIEGSGKSTLLAAVEGPLRAQGRDLVVTREPGGTPAGDAIRRVFIEPHFELSPMAETLLVNASRAQLVADVIGPALKDGKLVLCDRYVHSSLAYQGYGREQSLDAVRAICNAATGGLMPDLTLLIDVSYETSRERLHRRGNADDRLEKMEEAFHRRARAGFLELAEADPRIIVIDGEHSEEQVYKDAMEALARVLT
ncbi:MAG TPA: dTMP kinase [Candidatus Rubrimentiphilum sp.]|nr:dTMP kinase [Candidatus Rubrimentiphilum sp.]